MGLHRDSPIFYSKDVCPLFSLRILNFGRFLPTKYDELINDSCCSFWGGQCGEGQIFDFLMLFEVLKAVQRPPVYLNSGILGHEKSFSGQCGWLVSLPFGVQGGGTVLSYISWKNSSKSISPGSASSIQIIDLFIPQVTYRLELFTNDYLVCLLLLQRVTVNI